MKQLLSEIKKCRICEENLPFPPKPVLRASKSSRILIVGQAPGIKVQQSGIPWDDQSGKLLRSWLNISEIDFYDDSLVAIVPMGFCYPGKGKSGDLPPRKECAEKWHGKVLNELKAVKLTLLIGAYAQKYFLGNNAKKNLTETVKNFGDYLPKYLPLPHPSPRNRHWFTNNPWFNEEIIPVLRVKVSELLG